MPAGPVASEGEPFRRLPAEVRGVDARPALPGVDPHDEWAVGRDLRADPETADVPICFLTARADLRGQEESSIGGAVGYLTKPFNPLDLAPTLRRVAGLG